MGEFKEAKKLLIETQTLLRIKNSDFEDKIKLLNSMIKEIQFFECIEKEDEISKLKFENLEIEKAYNGPLINENTEMSQDLIDEITRFLEQQKRLPKKSLWILLSKAKQIFEKEKNVEYIDLNED